MINGSWNKTDQNVQREYVNDSFAAAASANSYRFNKGDPKATSEYIYENQREDATRVVNMFDDEIRAVSIQKKTKVGADGLMLEIVRQMTTHRNPFSKKPIESVRILTAMSNLDWEKDMIDKAPDCLKQNIFHHGKLKKADLVDLRNGLIFIDEIDTGDKEEQRMADMLKASGILDVKHMKDHNNHFVFISATMLKELYDLYKWGPIHGLITMTIPQNYIGHGDFLNKGIIKEFFALDTPKAAEKWVMEDILDNYGSDYRIHICRSTKKNSGTVQNACIKNEVMFIKHDSKDRIPAEELNLLFSGVLSKHVVVMVKGFFRRANLIPNDWKLRIGTIHEQFSKQVDNSVQAQGLVGRLTGYWRNLIEDGHKTGPYRTSMKAIREYEQCYKEPFGKNNYQSNGFKMRKGEVSADNTILSPHNIANLNYEPEFTVSVPRVDLKNYKIFKDEKTARSLCKVLSYGFRKLKDMDDNGFYMTSLNTKKAVVSQAQAIQKVRTAYGTNNGKITYRTYYPCYEDITDKTTLRYVVIIRPDDKNSDKLRNWETENP